MGDVSGSEVAAVAATVERLFIDHHDELIRFAARRVGPDVAADVVADAFVVAWRRHSDIPEGRARQWLYGVVANTCKRALRDRERDRLGLARLAAGAAADQGCSVPSAGETGSPVLRAFESLPVSYQEALRLVEWDELPVREAATLAGCSGGAFRVRLHRARRALMARLARTDGGEAASVSVESGVEGDR